MHKSSANHWSPAPRTWSILATCLVLALLASACKVIDPPSAGLTCTSTTECDAPRVCEMGYCVVPTALLPDADPAVPDAEPPPDADPNAPDADLTIIDAGVDCGNGTCGAGENPSNCAADCGNCALCTTGGECADTCPGCETCAGECVCTYDCVGASDCSPICAGECDFDCTNATTCTPRCVGAECSGLIDCTGATTCNFDSCPGAEVSCPNSIIVCQRPCP